MSDSVLFVKNSKYFVFLLIVLLPDFLLSFPATVCREYLQ